MKIKMKKAMLMVLMILVSVSAFAKDVREISDERATILVNYLQYSLTQIMLNPDDRVIAGHEFEKIDNINKSILKDENIINAYTNMLTSLSELKLNADEKEYIEKLAKRNRENAIYNIFNSAGSIFVPGQNPILSIAYASINAGLNYAGAVKQANDTEFDNKFKNWKDLEYKINDARIALHDSTARAFSYRDDTNLLVSTTNMDDFIKAIKMEDLNAREFTLEKSKIKLEMFPPFWFALGYSYHKNGKYIEAIDAYKKYETMLNAEKIFDYDEILSQVYLSLIDIYMAQDSKKYEKDIYECINKLSEQVKTATTDAQKYLTFSLANIYKMLGDIENSEKEFAELSRYKDENWNYTVQSLEDIINGTYKPYEYTQFNDASKNELSKHTVPSKKEIIIGLAIVIILNLILILILLYQCCGFALRIVSCGIIGLLIPFGMYFISNSVLVSCIVLLHFAMVCILFNHFLLRSELPGIVAIIMSIIAVIIPVVLFILKQSIVILLIWQGALSIVLLGLFILFQKIIDHTIDTYGVDTSNLEKYLEENSKKRKSKK